MSIRMRLMLGGFLFLILVVFSSGYSIYVYRQSRGDGAIMNLIGRQRSLCQKMTQQSLQYFLKPNDELLQQIQKTQSILISSHEALRNGGKIALYFDGSNVVDMPKPEFVATADRLDDAKPSLEKLQGAVLRLVEQAPRGDKTALNEILNETSVFVTKIGAAVLEAQQETERKATVLLRLNVLFLVLGLALVGGTLWVANSIGTALATLAKAADKISAGEVNEPVAINDTTEIGMLAQSFERMRVSVQKMIEKME